MFNFKHKLHDLKSFYTLYKYVETCHVPESLWVKLTLSCGPVTLPAQYSLIIYAGDPPQKETFITEKTILFQGSRGGPAFFNIFHGGGGGVQMIVSIETHITCDFPGRVWTPYPPSGSPHDVRIQRGVGGPSWSTHVKPSTHIFFFYISDLIHSWIVVCDRT